MSRDDLYFDFLGEKRPNCVIGHTATIDNAIPSRGGDCITVAISVASKREFPHSKDYFGTTIYEGRRYDAQICLNETLIEGDGIVLSPAVET